MRRPKELHSGQHSFSLFLALAFLLLPSHCLICIFGPFVWLHCLIHLNVPPAHPSRFDTFYKHLLKGLSQASNWHHYPLIHPKRKRLLLQSAHGRKKQARHLMSLLMCCLSPSSGPHALLQSDSVLWLSLCSQMVCCLVFANCQYQYLTRSASK